MSWSMEMYTQCPYVTNTGNTLNLEAQPDQNWEFDSWSGDLSGTDPLQNITMDQDKEVTATFTQAAPEEYTITLIANPEQAGHCKILPTTLRTMWVIRF